MSIYAITNVISRAIPFFLLPILTRYLTPYDYGIVATFQVLSGIVVVFVGLNMYGAMAVNYFKLSKQELEVYIGNLFFILPVSFSLTICIIYIAKSDISHLIKFPENWLPIIAIVALSQSVLRLRLTLWQSEQKALPYGLFQIVQTMTNIILSLFFVVALGWHWQGRLLGVIITSIIFGFISILVLCKGRHIDFSLNKIYIKDVLFFGVPLIPHALGGWIIASVDRFFINSMVNVATTGIYTVGYQMGMIIDLLATSFNQAWYPFLFEKLKGDKHTTKANIVKFTYIYDVIIIILALGLSFVAPYFLSFFVGEIFHSAHKYVLWIALGYAANGMYYMVVNYIFYVKKTHILGWITFISALIHTILCYYLVKIGGALGAAQATTISQFLTFFAVWYMSARLYKMPWGLRVKEMFKEKSYLFYKNLKG
jgi:O-antigen/teichoic acid export membrane protein